MSPRTFKTRYTPTGEEATFDIEFRIWPGRPAVMYLRNGDPGYPEDPAELEVLSVKDSGTDLTDRYAETLEDDDNFREHAWSIYEDFMNPPEE